MKQKSNFLVAISYKLHKAKEEKLVKKSFLSMVRIKRKITTVSKNEQIKIIQI